MPGVGCDRIRRDKGKALVPGKRVHRPHPQHQRMRMAASDQDKVAQCGVGRDHRVTGCDLLGVSSTIYWAFAAKDTSRRQQGQTASSLILAGPHAFRGQHGCIGGRMKSRNRITIQQTQRLTLTTSLATSMKILRSDAEGLSRYLDEQAAENPSLM
jgi:hypothetical protein